MDAVPMMQVKDMTPAEKKLAEAISQMYQMAGGIALGIGFRIADQGLVGTGAKTLEMADAISVAWIDLSRRNPAVKKWLQRVTEMGSTSVLVGMHVAIIVPLLIDRGVIPASMVAFAGGMPTANNGNGDGNSPA